MSDTAAEREPAMLSGRRVAAYSVANLGAGAFYAFNNYVLPLYLRRFTSNAILLGLMGSTHSVEGAVIQPIVGAASDRCRSPWGRRRPYICAGFVGSALLLVATPAGALLPPGRRLAAVVVMVFAFTLVFNIGWDPYQALMPDITPERQRGRVTGVSALAGNLAQCSLLAVAFMAGVPLTGMFLLVGAGMIVTTLITCSWTREAPLRGAAHTRHPLGELVRALRGLRTLRQAAIAIALFAAAGAGLGAVTPNLTLFVKTITKCSDAQAFSMVFLLLIVTTALVLPFGWLTDRLGPRAVVGIAFGLLGSACALAFFARSLGGIAVLMLLAGIGNAAQAAASYPLLTELVPDLEVGFYTGLQSTVLSILQPLTVAAAGALINRQGHDYRTLFIVCGACILVGAAMLPLIRLDQARAEIRARVLELQAGTA